MLLAHQRAVAEATAAWKLPIDAPVPFSYRWEHVQEVVRLACWLAEQLAADSEVVEAAAWLHDVCKGQPKHALAGAAEAEHFLPTTDFPAAKIPAVLAAIREHEGLYRKVNASPLEPLETAILWDADKLSKLGVQALAFSLSTVYHAGLTLRQRRENMLDFLENSLSRTVESMNTKPARRAAKQRYKNMVTVLTLWQEEEE